MVEMCKIRLPFVFHGPDNPISLCPFLSPLGKPYRTDTGPMRVDGNMTSAPNYFPNSFSGPKAAEASHSTWHKQKTSGDAARYSTGDEDNFTQVIICDGLQCSLLI